MINFSIRSESEADYREVEEVTREAFWNLYIEGCDEHYLVHIMRDHSDFIRELSFVAVKDGKIIGSIMYTRSYLIDESGARLETITFGPLCVHPEYQRLGVGTALIDHTKRLAVSRGDNAIIILGHPKNYLKHGFKVSKDINISDPEGKYHLGLMALELKKGILTDGIKRKFYTSDIFYQMDSQKIAEFDTGFTPKKKEYRYTQYEYDVSCRAIIE